MCGLNLTNLGVVTGGAGGGGVERYGGGGGLVTASGAQARATPPWTAMR
jgi:hypothetical protein